MNSTPLIRALVLSVSVLALTAGSTSAADHRHAGFGQRHDTIDGRYLPPPPPPFGGTINLDATDSKPYWPPTVVPPKGAPNVLLIMTDDQGYGIPSTFGGVIPTPTLDRSRKPDCATHSFTPPRCARPRERRCSPAVTITPWALA